MAQRLAAFDADIDAFMSCGCKLMACLGDAFVHDGSSTSGLLLPLPLCRLRHTLSVQHAHALCLGVLTELSVK